MPIRYRITASRPARQRGMVLIVSLLLLLVVTLLAVAMFRGMGVSAKIAGNVREKQRALHAAESAEQFAANWLLTAAANGAVPQATDCNSGIVTLTNLSSTSNQVLVCSNQPYGPTALSKGMLPSSTDTFVPTVVPWKINGTTYVGFQYSPPGMTAGSCPNGSSLAVVQGYGTYVCPPMFFISEVGALAGSSTEAEPPGVYQIDAIGYGATMDSVAVVESTYSVGAAVSNHGGGNSK